jgi:hypothetical protein
MVRFGLEDVRDALFASTYDVPRTLLFSVEQDDDDWPLFMLVLAARALWTPYRRRLNEIPTGRWPYANWYLEGYLFTSPLDETPERVPMRAYIDGIEQDPPTNTYVQVERFIADVPPVMPLRLGIGAPGQPMP